VLCCRKADEEELGEEEAELSRSPELSTLDMKSLTVCVWLFDSLSTLAMVAMCFTVKSR